MHRARAQDLLEAVAELARAGARYRVPIMLEIEPHGNSYADVAQLNVLCDAIDVAGVPKHAWGICVDTAHIWAAGTDISSAEGMSAWLQALKSPEKVKLVHLNGCQTALGFGRDQHALVTSRHDLVFIAGRAGADVMYRWCRDRGIPMIMEINMKEEFAELPGVLQRLQSL